MDGWIDWMDVQIDRQKYTYLDRKMNELMDGQIDREIDERKQIDSYI